MTARAAQADSAAEQGSGLVLLTLAAGQFLMTLATVELSGGVPFISDTQLEAALAEAEVPPDIAEAAIEINADARLDGLRIALSAVVLAGIVALFFTARIPTSPPGGTGPKRVPPTSAKA